MSEVTPPALQAKVMSCYTLGWYYGQVAGFSIGGLLAHPEKIGIVSGGIFARFPYLLPNLVCSVLGFIALTGVIFCFKETLTPYKPANSSTVALTSSSHPFAVFRSANLRSMVCMYSINMFCDTGFVETYPLWCWSSKDKGGLNFDPQEIGGILTVSYIAMICVQTVLYSRMVKRIGLIRVIKANSTAIIHVLLGLPFIGLLRDTQWMLRFALGLGCLLYYLLGFNIVTSIFILTNNSVQQQDRAKVNAFLMSMGYIVKGFTPLLIGYLLAYTSEKGRVLSYNAHPLVYI